MEGMQSIFRRVWTFLDFANVVNMLALAALENINK